MQVFIFLSEKDGGQIGFTNDEVGTNLPSALGPWRPLGGRAMPIAAPAEGTISGDAILSAIEAVGYFVAPIRKAATSGEVPLARH
jgi:hypothetical protein